MQVRTPSFIFYLVLLPSILHPESRILTRISNIANRIYLKEDRQWW